MAVYRREDSIKAMNARKLLKKKLETAPDEIKLLDAQSNAMSDQFDFLEDCLVEMAMIVYAE
ncbi:MAG TPA: hypothetical protein IAC43_04815 [Candidatus Faecivivens stercoripullorum]|uniref:Uncharacterized protein n=1 Tax=Candidatus Faecivivens stercoripullorum TaxID=2840805 RepID=A0A9D1H824_9FIRM|nr:hypothetical protein [Candidatus Faecivivens stercoripullorum]